MKNIYSLSAHLKLHHNSTTSNTYLHSYMTLKVLDQLKPIGAKKIFTKPNCNLCIEELLMIKKLFYKHVTVMNRTLVIFRAFRKINNFHTKILNHWWYFLTGEIVRQYRKIQTLGFENVNVCFSTGNVFIDPTILRK